MQTLHDGMCAGTLREMLFTSAKNYGTLPALLEKKQESYEEISYDRLLDEVEAVGTALFGILPAAPRVLILGKGSYRFVLSLLAVTAIGGVAIPIDEALTAEQIAAVAEKTEANAIAFDGPLEEKVRGTGLVQIPFALLSELVRIGGGAVAAGDSSFSQNPPTPDTPAMLYAAGGGEYRSLAHKHVMAMLEDAFAAHAITPHDRFLSVLPIFHIYECVLGILYPLYGGASVAFAEDLHTVLADIRAVRATHTVAVPLLARAISARLRERLARGGIGARLYRAASVKLPPRLQRVGRSALSRILPAAGTTLREIILVGGAATPVLAQELAGAGVCLMGDLGVGDYLGLGGAVLSHVERADGKRVFPEKLEALLAKSPYVGEAAVIGISAERGEMELAACIYPDTVYANEVLGADHTGDDLEAAVADLVTALNEACLAPHEQISLFMLCDAPLPRDGNGAILRTVLAEMLDSAKND